ncbi:MAG: hypothetical protein KDD11_08875 [Acidobacteria bacterium]|nr:hypothetical protein [Acidobacteriota bacterium]
MLKRTHRRLLLVLGLLLVTSTLLVAARQRSEEPFLLGGIQVNEPDHERWVRELQRSGLNTVSVTVYAHQGDWNSDHLWFDEDNAAVLDEIRTAHRAGLRVVLILRLALDHAYPANRFLWHGLVMPDTEDQVRSWFEQYGRFALEWARRAEAEGVEVLGVGSELNTLTSTRPLDAVPALEDYYLDPAKQDEYRRSVLAHREALAEHRLWTPGTDGFATLEEYLDAEIGAHRRWAERVVGAGEQPWIAMNRRRELLEGEWRSLIRKVREVYHGPLTYAANFDQYQEVGFWQDLDLLGVNAYFQLRPAPAGPDRSRTVLAAQLETGWAGILGDMNAFRQREGLGELPVIFTELGYTARRGSTVEPWASQGFSLLRLSEGESPPASASATQAGSPEHPAVPPPLPPTRLMVWTDEPEAPLERALALRGLREAERRVAPGMLAGVLWWKLSTLPEHRAIEPFVMILGHGDDPALEELRRLDPEQRDAAWGR